MAGLNLTQAVRNYQDGVQFRQQQEQYARAKQQQAARDEADKAFGDTIAQSQQEWLDAGGQGTYQPNDMTMFKAAGARGTALAKAGDWQGWAQNEAAVQQQRQRVRVGAWQQFQQSGDIEGLVRAVHSTVNDGRDIVGIEKVQPPEPQAPPRIPGAPDVAQPQAPTLQDAQPQQPMLRIRYSDGHEETKPAAEIVRGVQSLLVDPVKTAEKELELNFLNTKNLIETSGKVRVEQEKGNQARQTEGVKHDNAVSLEGVKFGNERTLTGIKEAGANQRARIGADATLGAASIRAKASGEGKAGDEQKRFKQTHDEITRIVGQQMQGALGGTRISNEQTMAAARYAQALMDNEGMSYGDAIGQAVAELKKRSGKGGR